MRTYLYNIHYLNEFITSAEKSDEYEVLPPETQMAPPEAIPHKAWCFNVIENKWTHTINDYRGNIIYNCKSSKITDTVKFAGEIKDGWTLTAPPNLEDDYRFDGFTWVALPKICSKLAIRRACRNLGIENKLNNLLAENTIFHSDWADAQDIDLNDTVTKQALLAGEFTESEIAAIIGEVQP